MRLYDKVKHADAVSDRAKLQISFDAIRDELNTLYDKDGVMSDSDLATYTAGQQRHAQLEREIGLLDTRIRGYEALEPEAAKASAKSAFARFMNRGNDGLEADEIKMHSSAEALSEWGFPAIEGRIGFVFCPQAAGLGGVQAAATRSDNTSGMELVEETVLPRVVERLAFYGGVSKMAQQFMTATGNDYRIPQHDESTVSGRLLAAQNTEVTTTDLANFGVVQFGALTASSDAINITMEMIQDSIIDIERYAESAVVRRLGRLWDTQATTGNGTAPNRSGVVTLSTEGKVAAAATSIAWSEILDVIYSVNRAYREGGEMGEGGYGAEMGGRTGFLISDGCEKALMQLADGDNRPLWAPSLREGDPARIFGYPYEVSGPMATVGANNIPLVFGNFSYYGIRTVAAVAVYRFMDSNTMQRYAVQCMGFSRRDMQSMIALQGGKIEPLAHLKMAATDPASD